MTAPRVVIEKHRWDDWDWKCDACHGYWKRASRYERAIQAATAHSRTHTAERVAAHLDDTAGTYERNHDDTTADALEWAAGLVREHLT